MLRIREGRFSARTLIGVIGLAALVAALGGSALAGRDAATSVSAKKVKKIATRQAKKQVKALAPGLSVAHAGTADSASRATRADAATSAANASSANSVNGVELRRFNYHGSLNSGPTQIFSGGGLTLEALCNGAGSTEVVATTSVPDSYLGSDAFFVGAPNTNVDAAEKDPFSPGDRIELLPNSGGASVVGHTGYYNRGSNVQLDWTADRNPTCDFVGFAAIG